MKKEHIKLTKSAFTALADCIISLRVRNNLIIRQIKTTPCIHTILQLHSQKNWRRPINRLFIDNFKVFNLNNFVKKYDAIHMHEYIYIFIDNL